MTNNIAVVFDKNYIIKALALYESALLFVPNPKFWFLCMDKEALEMVACLKLNGVEAREVSDIGDLELLAVRDTRSIGEFAMSSKAAWLRYILNNGNLSEEDMLIFIDADILFYSSAESVIEKCRSNGSITITHHKFSKDKEPNGEIAGQYNSGLIFFRPDLTSRTCIEEWRKQCIDWCYLYLDNGRHGDQRYLNDWPQKYPSVYILPDKGVNVGTWSIKRFDISLDKTSHFQIDEDPLVCYHFHGLKIYLQNGKVKMYPVSVHYGPIYYIYNVALQKAHDTLLVIDPGWQYGFSKNPGILRIIKQHVWKILGIQ